MLLSYLFFVDDLVLFGESTLEIATAVHFVLDEFCVHSGHKVSSDKSRLCFSKNTDVLARGIVGRILGFQQTEDLGIYLGVPLFHSRMRHSTFQFIIDKVQ